MILVIALKSSDMSHSLAHQSAALEEWQLLLLIIFDLQGSTCPWKWAVLPANSENFIEPKHQFSGLKKVGCQVSGISEDGKNPRKESSILAKGKPFYNSKHFSLSKKLFLLDFGRTNHEVLVRHDKFWVQQESSLWAVDKHSHLKNPYVFFSEKNTIQNFGGFPRQLYHINGESSQKVIQLWRCGDFAISFSARLNLDASVDGEKEPIPPAVRGSTWERTERTNSKAPCWRVGL